MAEYPIIMKQKNDQGTYDTLYPKTLGSQVQGNIQSSQISGNIPSSQITGTFPASQITGLPTSLPANGGNADTVENQTVQQIIQSALDQGMQVETGSYVGTGKNGKSNPNTLTFGFEPKVVFVINGADNSNTFFHPSFGIFINGNSNGFIVYSTQSTTQGGAIEMNGYYSLSIVNFAVDSLSWYVTSSSNNYQLNTLGTTYNYIAIG